MAIPDPPEFNRLSLHQQWYKLADHLRLLASEEAARLSRTFATDGPLAGDVDVVAEGGSLSIRVRVGIGGTLVVVYDDDSEDTLYLQSGDIDKIAVKAIKQTSTAELITVYW